MTRAIVWMPVAACALGLGLSTPAHAKSSHPAPAMGASEAPKAAANAYAGMDPEVKKVVQGLQRFYEKTTDFSARFEQTYTYASFHRVQKSSGRVIFLKPALMRWDYEVPDVKTIIVTGAVVYMYDAAAQQITKAPLNMERLSASVTFLWGKGNLAEEFNIRKASRKDLAQGIGLELIPKKPDPRFDRVFFLVDPKTDAVAETIVVDPDGSENHMVFKDTKIDQHLGEEAFKFEPPPGTQVQDLSGGQPAVPASVP